MQNAWIYMVVAWSLLFQHLIYFLHSDFLQSFYYNLKILFLSGNNEENNLLYKFRTLFFSPQPCKYFTFSYIEFHMLFTIQSHKILLQLTLCL